MPTYTDVFGGSTVQPSDVQFSEFTLSANTVTYWPQFATSGQVMARIMKVNASVGSLTLSLPDATLVSAGQDVLFDNSGANTFTVLDYDGTTIATVAAGQVKYFYLSDNATQAGTWRTTLFGAGSSSVDASQLKGYGLKTIANTLNVGAQTTVMAGNTTVVSADQSKVFIWTGGSGTLTLPTTVGSTSDFAIEVRNQGTGTVTLAPVGGALIDDSATITLSVQESCFVHMGATDWYTVGRGRNTAFNFTQLTKTITGGTTVLTLTEASNVVQKYIGTLTSNAIVTLPAVVQVYYVSNNTTGAYTLTFGCAGGGTSVPVTQAQAAILFCDGVNIVNANTSLSGGISSIVFGAGTVTTPSVALAEAVTGLYATGTHEIGFTCNGVYVGKWTPTGFVAVGTISGSNLSGTNTGDQTNIAGNAGTATALQTARTIDGVSFNGTTNITVIAPATNAATSKATPVDADVMPIADSAASFGLKKLTWANLKATLKTYFDTLYLGISATAANASQLLGFTWTSPGAIGSTTPNSGAFTTLSATGNATLGDAEATDTHTVKGATTVLANSASPALKVTQTGAGNAFVVEDSASTDSTPFVIDASGRVILGATQAYNATGGYTAGFSQYAVNGESTFGRFSNDTNATFIDITKSRGASLGVHTIVQPGDTFGKINFAGSDGTNFIVGAQINSQVDGTPGTNDMPGRLVFSTTADGAASPTERMRIDSSGNVGIGTPTPTKRLEVGRLGSSLTITNVNATTAVLVHPGGGAATSSADIGIVGQDSAQAAIRFGKVSDAQRATIVYDATADALLFSSGGTSEDFRLSAAGYIGVGKSNPLSAVDTTSFGTNIVNNSGTTYTVLATDHTIVQKTVAAVYTLPSAASFTARRLHLVTQFMGSVTSASANVVPITGGSASTQILSSTDGGYAVLQSDGTNWVVIAKSENSGVFNVKDFGATGDGAANDTAAIQAAITAASVSGGTVYLPNGTYLVSSTLTITSNNVEIEGQSKGGVIITRSGNYGHTFDFHGNSGTGAMLTDCSIKSMTIKSTGLTTSGAHINFVGVTRSNISDIYFYNGFVGMQLNGATACTVSDIYLVFDNLYTGSATGRRYMEFGNAGGSYVHQSSGDIFVSNFNLRGTTTTQFTEFGINILSADGIWFNNGHVGNASSVNLRISGGTTEMLNLVYFDTVMFDEGALYSLLIEGSLSTNFRDIKFDNCNFKSGGAPAYCDYGIVVAPACTVQHLLFSNCTVSEFGIGGVVLQSIASRLVKFEGCHVFGNGRDSSGTQPGYNVYSGVQDLEISGGLSGRLYNDTGTGTQSYGIQFGGSHTNVRVVGVDLTGNVTKSLIGAETVYVSDCLLQDSTTVASASTVTLPNSGSVFHISGTTTIDNIQVTNPGRNVTLIFDGVLTVTDAGNKKLVGAMTTAAWSTLSLVYDGTWWVETSRSAT